VSSGVDQLDGVVAELNAIMVPAQKTMQVLPGLLGGDGPRNLLVLVQNNAESRGTGGNPAAVVMLTIDDGQLTITHQAASTDFNNDRDTPIVDLDAETVALYTDKVGRFMQDVTTTPDFTESARIMAAFWAETVGTPIDGTLSIDPVALGYLLNATGPVTLEDGDVLTSETVVPMLLNEVYFRYNTGNTSYDNQHQDAYFAMAASGILGALTTAQDPLVLVQQAARAVHEGRILYAPTSQAEEDVIAGTRITGQFPVDNSQTTMVGSYINDITEGKLDYYVRTAVNVASDQCTVDAATAPTFTVSTTLDYTLQPGDVAGLARYISPGRYFPKGELHTDVVVYGPVGTSITSVTVNGVHVEDAVTPLVHLGRPAIKVNIANPPATATVVSVGFTGVAGEHYGPIEAWHTPMVSDTPVTVDAPGCAGSN